jgi:hypothetical protein
LICSPHLFSPPHNLSAFGRRNGSRSRLFPRVAGDSVIQKENAANDGCRHKTVPPLTIRAKINTRVIQKKFAIMRLTNSKTMRAVSAMSILRLRINFNADFKKI